MKKARLIFLGSLVFMAFSAFKGNPHAPEEDKQTYHQSTATRAADSLHIR
jgi:hypothetical protein